jgi:cardiolipin synthase
VTTKNSAPAQPRFRWLKTGNEAFEEMLRAIAEAKFSVRMETYIYSASPIGERFRQALHRAAARGAEVKVLIDAFGSMALPDAYWEPVRRDGGEVRWFNPLSLERGAIRDHRKLLVCDGAVAFVGGFNIAAEYEGDGVTEGWRDCGVVICGEIARELAVSFDAMFAMADFSHKRLARFRRASIRHVVSTREGQILLTGPGRGKNLLKRALLNDLRRASHVRIISAYFVPTLPIRRALTRAARRGCRVQIILAGQSDVPFVQAASRRFYQAYLKSGIEIYEYQPQILHAKLVLVDGVVYVGSANLDRRSLYINYELVLRLPEADLGKQAAAMFDRDLALCRKIDARTWRKSRTFWNKLLERWAYFLIARVDPFIARRQLRHLR